ncbi:hypothetical protein CLV99_0617 [Sphingobacterium yanglingense]|uniref:Uncharacterized protein n=1 Tax=Sphingobacterium yanglingense TaxID=1437280 RepID=A0A4R6WLI9_9SPHI|nr:hypothetical protein CLV99_0617 [Sphingobacterium yanglingense]
MFIAALKLFITQCLIFWLILFPMWYIFIDTDTIYLLLSQIAFLIFGLLFFLMGYVIFGFWKLRPKLFSVLSGFLPLLFPFFMFPIKISDRLIVFSVSLVAMLCISYFFLWFRDKRKEPAE